MEVIQMNDKSFINTKKLIDSLLSDLDIQIDKKENELLELKIKSNTAKKLISISKNINHFKPIVDLLKTNVKHQVRECLNCNAIIISIKNRKFCSGSCRSLFCIKR
tara:strand:- start:139 stop:456 length:318 start_codon:yes stop_codon:yes gene_type:complete